MEKVAEKEYLELESNEEYEKIINKVIEECFKIEDLQDSKLYISITLTNPENIKKLNKQYRNIDKETDVLSFPMFEKEEIENLRKNGNDIEEALGDIVISLQKVEEQAQEYGHSFERELSYMLIHGFYHLMGYDHMNDNDKVQMREKEEGVLNKLQITR